MTRSVPLPLLSLALLVSAGCSRGIPPTYPASGTVVFRDGRPVTSGVVEFESSEQPFNARGVIASDGTFRLNTRGHDGAIAGRHRAIVVQALAGGIGDLPGRHDQPGSILLDEEEHEHEHEHVHAAEERPAVAPRFGDYRTSNLEFEIAPEGENRFVIEVDSVERSP